MQKINWPSLPPYYERDIVTVKGGFPVIAAWMVHSAEPDVGISGPWIDDIQLFTLRGKRAAFIEKRMSRDDYDRLAAELLSLSH